MPTLADFFNRRTIALILAGCVGSLSACATDADSPTRTSATSSNAMKASMSASIRNPEFLRQFAETRRFSLGKPTNIRLSPDGKSVLFLRSKARDRVQDLYEFDVATKTERVLLTSDTILGGAAENLSPEELARRERMRLTARGITSYSLSKDGSTILVPLSDRLFLVNRATKAVRELKSTAGFPIDAQLSPDATKLACVRNGDLYLFDLTTGGPNGQEQRLTFSGSDSISNGTAEFAAQEEMDRLRGFWWSPDSSSILYQQTDTTGMEVFTISDPANPGKPAQTWPYPRTGTKNADVRFKIVNLKAASGESGAVSIAWDRERYPYVARVGWSKDAPPTMLVQNRPQTEQVLLAIDPATGSSQRLLIENDPAWINLAIGPKWLPGGKQFLWMTEQGEAGKVSAGADTRWNLQLRNRDGSLAKTLVNDAINLDGLAGVTSGSVWVSGGQDPRQSHLFRVPLDGSSPPAQITNGEGAFGAVLSDDENCPTRVMTAATSDGTESWTVVTFDPSKFDASKAGVPNGDVIVGTLTSAAEKPLVSPKPEFTTVGSRNFRAVVLGPSDMVKGRKYPVILSVYGGPGGPRVSTALWSHAYRQWLADQGFIVVELDGRGLHRRGRAWDRAWKETDTSNAQRGNLIDVALDDQVEGLKALAAKYPEMDMSRVGVTGWSFGGYFSAMATIRRGDVFAAGVVGAPVTDWIDYDTHYTERFLGTPQSNPDGYSASSVLTYASQLKRPLLLIHGTADDNVYFVHTLKLTDALFRAGKDFEFQPLTGHTHVVADPQVVATMHTKIVEFFKKTLGER